MRKPDHYILVGLTAGVAGGKSTVASMLQELGALWINADRLAQELIDAEPCRSEIRAAFGDEVFESEERVDRRELAARVFDDPEALAALEAIVHPRVQKRTMELILGLPTSIEDPAVVVLDIPLLEKSPFGPLCDHVVFVDAPEDERERRVSEIRGWTAGELQRREGRQKSVDAKRAEADFVILNSGGMLELKEQVVKLWDDIKRPATNGGRNA